MLAKSANKITKKKRTHRIYGKGTAFMVSWLMNLFTSKWETHVMASGRCHEYSLPDQIEARGFTATVCNRDYSHLQCMINLSSSYDWAETAIKSSSIVVPL